MFVLAVESNNKIGLLSDNCFYQFIQIRFYCYNLYVLTNDETNQVIDPIIELS